MRWLALLFGGALGLGCGGASSPKPPDPTPATAAATEPAPDAFVADDDLTGVVGHAPPEWQVSAWFNSEPLTLAGLRGRAVFVRWFMSPDCPFCSGSAPVLRELHERFAASGLVVVGMYHHKSEKPLDPEQVRGWVEHYGYRFPVAIDAEWRTLRSWWLDGHERGFTSVSFLIDRKGLVRWVHLGGLIEPGGAEHQELSRQVEALLAEAP